MNHSKMFDKIKNWFDKGLWDITKVYDAVPKLITAEEFEEITGEPYVPVN